MAITADDLRYLRRTLQLARKAHCRTLPNPMVGAIIVNNGTVVGEGYHQCCGGPHAEVFALRAAGEQARGATLYVSLEPCSHHGRTPPCADAVIAAGIRRVVFASLDPNPKVAGNGVARLCAAGIMVEHGPYSNDEQYLNAIYRHWIATRRPYVTLKLAASLDGKIATHTGDAKWITGEAARRDVHRLRAASDAILTSAATVCADNPALTARLPGARNPRRIILDTRLETLATAKVYDHDTCAPILVTACHDELALQPFRQHGVEVLILPPAEGGLDLNALMDTLGNAGVVTLMVEGGGRLAAALLDGNLVQRVRIYYAPMLIGGATAPTIMDGRGASTLTEALRLQRVTCRRIGEDFRVEGIVSRISTTPDGDC